MRNKTIDFVKEYQSLISKRYKQEEFGTTLFRKLGKKKYRIKYFL